MRPSCAILEAMRRDSPTRARATIPGNVLEAVSRPHRPPDHISPATYTRNHPGCFLYLEAVATATATPATRPHPGTDSRPRGAPWPPAATWPPGPGPNLSRHFRHHKGITGAGMFGVYPLKSADDRRENGRIYTKNRENHERPGPPWPEYAHSHDFKRFPNNPGKAPGPGTCTPPNGQ